MLGHCITVTRSYVSELLVPTEVTIRLLDPLSGAMSAQPCRAKPDSGLLPVGFPVRIHMRRTYTPCFRWNSVVIPVVGSRIVPPSFRKVTSFPDSVRRMTLRIGRDTSALCIRSLNGMPSELLQVKSCSPWFLNFPIVCCQIMQPTAGSFTLP